MTNAQYRSFSGTYRVTVEFSLKYCDYSIKRKSSSNVGYGTNRNSVKGSQVVVTTRKQNFFKKKIAKYSLRSLLYQHTRQISNQNSFLNEYHSDSAIENSRKRKLSNTLM